jgi:hypothetical protein
MDPRPRRRSTAPINGGLERGGRAEARNEKFCGYYAARVPVRAMAAAAGIDPESVRRIVRRKGVPRRSTGARNQEMVRDREDGMSLEDIAAKFGLASGSVEQIVKHAHRDFRTVKSRIWDLLVDAEAELDRLVQACSRSSRGRGGGRGSSGHSG